MVVGKGFNSDGSDFNPPAQGITAQNLTRQYQEYGTYNCRDESTDWQDAASSLVFSRFLLDTDGGVTGNSLSLEGDSSLVFTVKAKCTVRITITSKSSIMKNQAGFQLSDTISPPVEVLLEGGDSINIGTRLVSGGFLPGMYEFKDFSIIKNGTEKINASNGLVFLKEANQIYAYNSFDIIFNKAWFCEDRPPEEEPILPPPVVEEPVVEEPVVEEELESESESENFELNPDTQWAILGGLVLLLLVGFLFKNPVGEE
tara:strand:+ start:1050 stop:1823 length:774 start_codon:yes stop_codon:yes gene_type:complete